MSAPLSAPSPDVHDEPAFGAHAPSALWRWHLGRRDLGTARSVTEAQEHRLRRKLRRSRPVFDVHFEGLDLRLYPGENVCDLHIAIFGAHTATAELGRVAEQLGTAKVFVDIGANIGLYTLLARKMMPADGTLLAFEPDPRTAAKLRCNLSFNNAKNVQVMQHAVGETEETLTLHRVSRDNVGRNSLHGDLVGHKPGDSVDVSVRPLKTVLDERNIGKIDVLKIDVEGFEATALMPYLAATEPALWPDTVLMEIAHRSHWPVDVVQVFKDAGYEASLETETEIHLQRAPGRGAERED